MTTETRAISPMGQAALDIVRKYGWPVFPVHSITKEGHCTCSRGPSCGNKGKHPRNLNGRNDASTAENVIRGWWRGWPSANIGIPTGVESGLAVCDVDVRTDGDATMADLERQHGALPETPRSITGSGGWHALFKYPKDIKIKSGTDLLGPGIDVKAFGGYIIAPPSLHASTNRYEWDAGAHPDDLPLAELPQWIVEKARDDTSSEHEPIDMGDFLDGVEEGQRNEKVWRVSCKLRGAGVPYDIACELILKGAAAAKPPYPAKDALDCLNRAYKKYGPNPTIHRNGTARPPTEKIDPLDYRLTDSGNAELFAALYADQLRYDHGRKRWLRWAEHWWEADADGEIYRLAKTAARIRHRRAIDLDDADKKQAVTKWAIQSENRAKIDSTLHLARSEYPIADPGTGLDSDPWLLGVGNGVVDLRNGVLHPGKPADRVTIHTPTHFDPDARAPRFERFIAEIFSENAELIDFVWRAIGYSISGDTSEEVAFFCWGTGRNGKSKLLTTLRATLGDYAHNMPFSALELNTRSAIPSDVAALVGRRFVSASEITEGFRLNEARLKALTGNDPISARFMYEDFFTFRPVAKYWLAVNHKPVVLDDSTGFWSRVRLIPFLRQFTGSDADKMLEATLVAEAPGILTWAVRGCLAWQERGLTPPQIVVNATAEYREESDPLGAFILERCVTGDDTLSVAAGELYKAYRAWAGDRGASGREILSDASFGRRMGARFRKVRGARGNTYHGIGLQAGEGV